MYCEANHHSSSWKGVRSGFKEDPSEASVVVSDRQLVLNLTVS